MTCIVSRGEGQTNHITLNATSTLSQFSFKDLSTLGSHQAQVEGLVKVMATIDCQIGDLMDLNHKSSTTSPIFWIV